MNKLAIVIPAFKSNFFDLTISSIAKQTCKNFIVYIGDDASPNSLEDIVDKYKTEINIVYKRFDYNIGGENLVAHWERCIDLIDNEEWIWLFSDDDIMDPNCVENFYITLNSSPGFDIYHFNVFQINSEGNITDKFFSFPDIFSSEQFVLTKIQSPGCFSVVVEYVFKRSSFMETGRFVNFDLAWGSDDATWIRLSKKSGIKTINYANIYWRESLFNISPNDSNPFLLKRKLLAEMHFAEWIINRTVNKELNLNTIYVKQLLKKLIFNSVKNKVQFLSFYTLSELLSKSRKVLLEEKIDFSRRIYIYFYKCYAFFKTPIKKIIVFFKFIVG